MPAGRDDGPDSRSDQPDRCASAERPNQPVVIHGDIVYGGSGPDNPQKLTEARRPPYRSDANDLARKEPL